MTAVTYERRGDTGRIVLDRAPVNGFTLEFVRELDEALDAVGAHDPSGVVLESAVEGTFSAGGDLDWYTTVDTATMRRFVAAMHRTFRTIETLPVVFVAAINGHCLAGGLELALACDVRIASDGPWQFGCPETDIGAIPGAGGTQRLAREIGRGDAIDLLVGARRLSTSEAADIGLLQRVYAQAEFDEVIEEYVQHLESGAHRAYSAAKLAVTQGMEMGLDQGLQYEQQLQYELFETDDFEEGVAAFTEKREPSFSGR